jgi:hypothetical protein
MAHMHSTAACNAATNAVVGLLGSGAKLKFRLSGTIGAPGTVVSTLSLSATPFASAVGGIALANTITQDSAATGNVSPVATATLETSSGTIVVHCTVAAAGADINMAGGLTIAPGDVVTCSRLNYAALVDKTTGMKVGMNLAGNNNYNGTIVFKNLMETMNGWTQQVGTSSFSGDYGELIATGGTDEFTTNPIDTNLVGTVRRTGPHVVLNPSGVNVAIGTSTVSTDLHAFSNSTAGYTFTYSGGPLIVRVKGSCQSTAGKLAIVHADDLADYLAGNIWAPEFLAFLQGLNLQCLRMMEFSGASGSLEVNFSERARPDKTKGVSAFSGACVPWEWQIDLANRLNIDPWICLGARVNDAYMDALFAMWKDGTGYVATSGVGNVGSTGLRPDRKLWIELCNETWNSAPPYTAGWNWFNYYNHPKYNLTINPATNPTLVNWTGCPTTGTLVSTFTVGANRLGGLSDSQGNFWTASFGGTLEWHQITANTGELWYDGAAVSFPVGKWGSISLLAAKNTEATVNNDAAFGARTVQMWSRAATQFGGTSRLVRVMGAMAAAPSIGAARLAVTGGAANCDALAFAPYYNGEEVIAYVDISTGALGPKVYASQDGTWYINIYAGGTPQPPDGDLISAAPPGALHHQQYTYVLDVYGARAMTVKTGLTNGTPYEVFASFKSNDANNGGVITTLHATVSPNATPSTTVIYDTTENQKVRNIVHQVLYCLPSLVGHKAVIAASGNTAIIPVAYESGNHLDSHYETLELKAWLYGTYLESGDYVDVITNDANQMAYGGMVLNNQYEDCHGGSFSIANSHIDTSDPRYLKFASFRGYVPSRTQLTASNITPSGITAAPSYPYTVATFSNPLLSYRIISGDLKRNYDISGTTLRMVNGTGVSFASNEAVVLKILATDGFTSAIFNASFSTGPSTEWESSSIFYWDSIADSSATAMNPSVGTTMAKSGGVDATISGGLWTAAGGSGTSYEANPAMTASLSFASNWMLEIVLNKGTMTGGFNIPIMRIGGSSYLQIGTWGGDTSVSCQISNGSADVFCDIPWDATTHAFWYAFDVGTGLITFGKDQTTVGTQAAPSGGWPGSMAGYVQYQGRGAKWGTTQVVQQAGLTVTQAKAIVAKLQTKHSIP